MRLFDLYRRSAEGLAGLAARRPWSVILIGLAVAVLGGIGTAELGIDQDLKALLPADTPSVLRLEKLRDRIGTQYNLIVTIESPHREANIAFGKALATRLKTFPELRAVVFHRDLSFFKEHVLLYLPLKELLDLRQKVIDRIRAATAKQTGLIVDIDDEPDPRQKKETLEEQAKKLDPQRWFAKYTGGAEVPGEYMETGGGRLMVVRANPVEPNTNIAFSKKLLRKVSAAIAALDPKRFDPQLRARVEGKYAERVGRVKGISSDISRTALFAVLALLAVIALYFRTLRSIPIVLLPIVVATLVTMGLAVLLYGTLNIVTTFIFAILLGLGIDFGIHLLSRYGFERRGGLEAAEALGATLVSTGPALLGGAATTVVVLFLLSLGRFQGFAQFGIVAGLGVIVALVVALIMVPALIAASERLRRQRVRPARRVASHADAPGPAWHKVLAWTLVAISFLGCVLSLAKLDRVPFEYDFTKLGRPRPQGGAAQVALDYRDAVGRTSTWGRAVALCDSSADCEAITRTLAAVAKLKDSSEMARWRARRAGPKLPASSPPEEVDDDRPPDAFAELRAELGGGHLLAEERKALSLLDPVRLAEMVDFLQAHVSIHTFVPARQADKLRIIADIRRRLNKRRGAMDAKTFARLARYLEVKAPITAASLPRWIAERFHETGGKIGRFVIIWNRGSKANYHDAKQIYRSFFDLPLLRGGTVPVAASYFVLVEVIDTLKADGPRVIGAAAIGVFVCLLLMFRSLRAAALIVIPLLVSIAWLAGVFLLAGWKLNLYSVVAFPLLVGLAIDDGIHIYHRWVETGDLRLVLREVGGAITLTTLTTFVGFAGLAFAGHLGIRSLGLTAGLGLWLCWLGAVVTLPALLTALQRGRGGSQRKK